MIALGHGEQVEMVRGTCEGRIGWQEEDGEQGFGYDSIFIPQGYDLSWSRIPMEEKNRISHRGQAARLIVPVLQKLASG